MNKVQFWRHTFFGTMAGSVGMEEPDCKRKARDGLSKKEITKIEKKR